MGEIGSAASAARALAGARRMGKRLGRPPVLDARKSSRVSGRCTAAGKARPLRRVREGKTDGSVACFDRARCYTPLAMNLWSAAASRDYDDPQPEK